MLTEIELRSVVREALAEVTPPAPWLPASVERALRSRPRTGWTYRRQPGARITLRLAAVLALIVVAVATTAVFVATHKASVLTVPANPTPTRLQTGSGGPGPWDAGMVTATTGWRESMNGAIERTTDGGSHWVNVSPPAAAGVSSARLYFLDATHAWVVGSAISGTNTNLMTFRTADGGRRWDQGQQVPADNVGGPPLYFVNPNDGWMLLIGYATLDNGTGAPDVLYRTTDGGLHWNQLAANSRSDPSKSCQWRAVAFASASRGWLAINCAAGSTEMLATDDGGKTWLPQPALVGAADAPTVFDQNHAMVVHPPGLLVTSDAGGSWSARTLPGEMQLDVDFVDASHGWAIAGPSNLFVKNSTGQFPSVPGITLPLYRTVDGGLTWILIRTNLPLDSNEGRVFGIHFVDPQNGFADRLSVATQHGQVLKTTDGGQTWTVVGPLGD